MTRLRALLPGVAAAAVLGTVLATASLGSLARSVALGAIALSLAAAVVLRRETTRAHASSALAVAAVVAAGEARAGAAYGVACVAFALVIVVAQRGPYAGPRGAGRDGRRVAAVVVLVGIATAVVALLVTQLPVLARIAERQVVALLESEDEVGFTSTLRLGSTRGMFESDRIVMRLRGPRVDYLRGAVLDEYGAGIWRGSRDTQRRSVAAPWPPAAGATRVTIARGGRVVRGAEARWFVPAGACELGAPSGRVALDAAGIAHPDPPGWVSELSFRPACEASAVASDPPPDARERAISAGLRAQLEPFAARWMDPVAGDGAKLEAVARELRAFEYALAVERDPDVDPVIDLLTRHPRGHCELFASAMVLLARARGIPARVVTGYRTGDESPLTGATVVRDRDAHAWVEAWISGSWRTYDPTPARSERATGGRLLDDLSDLVSLAWDRAADGVEGVGVARLLLAVVVALGASYLVARLLRARRRGREARGALVLGPGPLPCFQALEAALARAGLTREPSEPLERFAARLRGRGLAEVASAIDRYAAHRYGAIGEGASVADEVSRAAARVPVEVPTEEDGAARV